MDVSEAPCLGCAILAGVATGAFPTVEAGIAQMVRTRRTYEPNLALHEQYMDKARLYGQVYPALAALYHQMYRGDRGLAEDPIAVVAGHLCLDVLPQILADTADEFRASFGPARLMFVGPVALSTGGAVSNTGIALHKLGIPVRLVGKIGDDMFGRVVRQVISSIDPGLADGLIVDRDGSTSYTVIINPPGIDRFFLHCPGPNDTFQADDVCFDGMTGVRLFHCGYPSIMRQLYADDGAQSVELFRRARETGATTSLDMAYPDPNSPAGNVNWTAIFPRLLPYVDVFLPSIEEILAMLRRDTLIALHARAGDGDILPLITTELLSDVSEQLLGLGVKVVVLKLGYRGLYVRSADCAAIEAMGAPNRPIRQVGLTRNCGPRVSLTSWEPPGPVIQPSQASSVACCATCRWRRPQRRPWRWVRATWKPPTR
jgi:sugar/nucleoside kinase (ribokinase family)